MVFKGDPIGKRFATHSTIAKFRAERFNHMAIMDVCCGIGMQAIYFALANNQVLAVDINPVRIKYAKENAKMMALSQTNPLFKVGDALGKEIIGLARDYDVIYADPARPPKAEVRTLEGLEPSLESIIQSYKGKLFMFDLPPQINRQLVPFRGTFEYISLYGKINRLTYYSRELLDDGIIASVLPKGKTLTYNREIKREYPTANEIGDYLGVVDEAIYYADLIPELFETFNTDAWLVAKGKRRTLISSADPLPRDFMKALYRVELLTDNMHDIKEFMASNNYARAVIRFNISPEVYWRIRNRIEEGLHGERTGYIFRHKGQYVLCQKVS